MSLRGEQNRTPLVSAKSTKNARKNTGFGVRERPNLAKCFGAAGNLTDVQTDVGEIASISPEMGGFGCLDPLGAVKCRGCAHRRRIAGFRQSASGDEADAIMEVPFLVVDWMNRTVDATKLVGHDALAIAPDRLPAE
jgi:hypothetical protein